MINILLNEKNVIIGVADNCRFENGIDYDGEIPTGFLENASCYIYTDGVLTYSEELAKQIEETISKERKTEELLLELEQLDNELKTINRRFADCYEANLFGNELPYDINELAESKRNIIQKQEEINNKLNDISENGNQ